MPSNDKTLVKKEPPKSKRGERRIEKAVIAKREKLRQAAPDVYTNLDDAYKTPESLPTLEEFAIRREIDRAYGEAHQQYGATKMVDMGPFIFERWLGKKQSVDGVNYRTPYYRAADITESPGALVKEVQKLPDGAGLRYGGFRNEVLNKYKKEHRDFQKSKTKLDGVKGAIGSVFPPANFFLAGGASIGGRNIPETLAAPVGAAAFVPMYKMSKRKSSNSQMPGQGQIMAEGVSDAALATLGTFGGGYGVFGKGIYQGGAGDLVVPTSGIGLNPFIREARQIRKETKKELKKVSEAQSRNTAGKSARLDSMINRESADIDRLIRLYENKYDVKVEQKPKQSNTYSAPTKTLKKSNNGK
jgi:hypothetical protein